MNKRIICVILTALMTLALVSCAPNKMGVFTGDQSQGSSSNYTPPNTNDDGMGEQGGEELTSDASAANKFENLFVDTKKNPVSEVALSSSKASYQYFRNLVNRGYTLAQLRKCSYDFKTEEFLNYFNFDSDVLTDGDTFGVGKRLFDCPWDRESVILSLTFKTSELGRRAPTNFVFCIDVSESMARDDVLPLFKSVFSEFVMSMNERDTVSIIACAEDIGVLVDGGGVDDVEDILVAVNSLEIVGGANNYDFEEAYGVAEKHFIEGGNNRVIIVSDGDVAGRLSSTVEENAENDIFTSVIGLGDSNYRNNKLEAFAEAGYGRYYYVDSEGQGKRILGREIFKSVVCDAEDVIASLEFDSDYVSEYRLIGYVSQGGHGGAEPDDRGPRRFYAGDVATLCYELKFADGIPYNEDFARLQLDYVINSDRSEVRRIIPISTDAYVGEPDADMSFMSLVIESVMILQDSRYVGRLSLHDIAEELEELDLEDHPEREEFRELIGKIIYGVKK